MKRTEAKPMPVFGLCLLLNFMAGSLVLAEALAEWVPTQTLGVELQNWVQVDLINSGQWLAVTTTRSTSEDSSRSQLSSESENTEFFEESVLGSPDSHHSFSHKE